MKLLTLVAGFLFSCTICFAQQKKIVKKPVGKATTTAQKIPVKPVIKDIPGTRILLTTDSGTMVIRLYDSTPLHRDNFIAKVNEGFYDSLLFHRVINGFMIQSGDPLSKNAQPGQMLGMGSAPGDRIPAEFRPTLFHKKGVLAAARDQNPEKASSNCQFYIVQGRLQTDEQLNTLQLQTGRVFTTEEREAYKTLGGTPFLDQNYTVFGEVEAGMPVIDKIASVPTAPGDRPIGDVRIKMKVLSEEEYKEVEKGMMPPKPKAEPLKKMVRKRTR